MSLDASDLVERGSAAIWPVIRTADVSTYRARVRRVHGQVPVAGPHLLDQLQHDLHNLSPKLRSVARFCIQHASTLHHCRIQDVAEACNTIPASVVRLAQRFGLRGFQEMKLAFLEPEDHEAVATSGPRNEVPDPECLAAVRDIERSVLGLTCLKGLVSTPEFLHAACSLRSARRIRFDWEGEKDQAIATHCQARLRAAGCHPIDTRNLDGASDDEWLVQMAVWHDLAPASIGLSAGFGPRVLRLAQGRMGRFAVRSNGGIVIQVGTDARRTLMALALCDALAAAVNPDGCSRD